MLELLANCTHSSDYATYLVSDPEKRIVKATYTDRGASNLKREYEGWLWYQSARCGNKSIPPCRILCEKRGYLKIEIDYIEGIQGDFKKGLIGNSNILYGIIQQYCAIWPCDSKGMSHLHGDFSLGNVFHNAEGIHVIDWEHFACYAAPWGFDPLYLLLETFIIGKRGNLINKKHIQHKEMKVIVECMRMLLRKNQLSKELLESPFMGVKEFMMRNSKIWNGNINKFPIFHIDEAFIRYIDKSIFEILKMDNGM